MHGRRGIPRRVEKKRRYTDGWTVDFPKGSHWRTVRKQIKLIALEREASIGAIVLEALQEYVENTSKKRGK